MAEARFPTPMEREKRSKLMELLGLGKVMIGVDATRPGVDLPPHLIGRPVVRLALSRLFRLDVFDIGPFEVRANLSFAGERHLCVVPWTAIFQMTSEVAPDEDVLFPDALSPQVLQLFAHVLQEQQRQAEAEAEADADTGSEGGGDATDENAAAPPPGRDGSERGDGDSDPPPPRRPHLRLID